MVLAGVGSALEGQDVHGWGADEAGDKGVGRVVVDLEGGGQLLEGSAVHDGDAVAEDHRFFLVVGDVDHGGAETAVEAQELGTGLQSQLGVEVAERLVEEEYLRVPHQGATEGDALALAARQLGRLAVEQLGDVEQAGCGLNPVGDERLGEVLHAQGEGEVLGDGLVRVQGVALKDHGDVAVLRRPVRHVALADAHPPARRGFEARDHAQGGGLAAAGGADQHDELAVVDGQIEGVDGELSAGILLGNGFERNGGHEHHPLMAPAVRPLTMRR